MLHKQTRQCVQTYTGHSDFVKAVVIRGSHLYSGSTDAIIKKFDIESGQELAAFKGHTRGVDDLLLSEDGEALYSSGSDCAIIKWDLATGKAMIRFEGHLTSVYKICMYDGTLYSGICVF